MIDEYNEVDINYWFLNLPSIILGIIFFLFSDFFNKKKKHNLFFYPFFFLYIFSFFYFSLIQSGITLKILFQFLVTFPILYSSFNIGLIFQEKKKQKKSIIFISKVFILIALFFLLQGLNKYGFLILLAKRPYTYSFYFLVILTFFIVSDKSEKLYSKIIFISPSLIIAFFSGSRSGLLLIFVLFFVYIIRIKLLLTLIPIIIIYMFLYSNMEFIDKSRFTSTDSNSRILIWKNVIQKINESENYFFGNGFIKPDFSTAEEKISIAHNTYLQLFFSYGLFGVILTFSMFYFFFKILYQKHLLMLISFALISFVNDLPLLTYEWSRIGEAIIFFFFFGSIFQNSEVKVNNAI